MSRRNQEMSAARFSLEIERGDEEEGVRRDQKPRPGKFINGNQWRMNTQAFD